MASPLAFTALRIATAELGRAAARGLAAIATTTVFPYTPLNSPHLVHQRIRSHFQSSQGGSVWESDGRGPDPFRSVLPEPNDLISQASRYLEKIHPLNEVTNLARGGPARPCNARPEVQAISGFPTSAPTVA